MGRKKSSRRFYQRRETSTTKRFIDSAVRELNSGQGDGKWGDDGAVAGRIVVELEKRSRHQLVVARNGEESFVLNGEKTDAVCKFEKKWERPVVKYKGTLRRKNKNWGNL